MGFDSAAFLSGLGPVVATDAVRAYNDFLTDFAAVDRNRLVPIAMLPYWDLEASIKEVRRVRDRGFPGILLAALMSRLGFPNLVDRAWDPLLAEIQDAGMSINLHLGFNSRSSELSVEHYQDGPATGFLDRFAFMRMVSMMNGSIVEAIADLIFSDIFDRFPRLRVVSVESGFGYIPYLLDAMDWHWRTSGSIDVLPARPMPSDIWRSHFYATFWFERSTIPLLEAFQDNVMFETDFPHETSVSPGPWDHSRSARDLVLDHLAGLKLDVSAKVLGTNAARLYGLALPN
jgi:predicted TIM-barrel fold metal-dependent hydrolase